MIWPEGGTRGRIQTQNVQRDKMSVSEVSEVKRRFWLDERVM